MHFPRNHKRGRRRIRSLLKLWQLYSSAGELRNNESSKAHFSLLFTFWFPYLYLKTSAFSSREKLFLRAIALCEPILLRLLYDEGGHHPVFPKKWVNNQLARQKAKLDLERKNLLWSKLAHSLAFPLRRVQQLLCVSQIFVFCIFQFI